MENRSKSLISVLFIISLLVPGFSQVKVGFRSGLNLAKINQDLSGTEFIDIGSGSSIPVELSKKNRSTFNVGGVLELGLSPLFALQFSALYNQKGVTQEGNVQTTVIEQGISVNVKANSQTTLKLTYLSFPLLAKVAFGQSKTKPYLIGGPEIGFLVSAKSKTKETAEATAQGQTVNVGPIEEEVDVKEELKTFEFAIDFGAGLMIPLGSADAYVDLQYSLGLTKLDKESVTGEGTTKNQVIMINVGLLFGSE